MTYVAGRADLALLIADPNPGWDAGARDAGQCINRSSWRVGDLVDIADRYMSAHPNATAYSMSSNFVAAIKNACGSR
jgi:hypothetical protein